MLLTLLLSLMAVGAGATLALGPDAEFKSNKEVLKLYAATAGQSDKRIIKQGKDGFTRAQVDFFNGEFPATIKNSFSPWTGKSAHAKPGAKPVLGPLKPKWEQKLKQAFLDNIGSPKMQLEVTKGPAGKPMIRVSKEDGSFNPNCKSRPVSELKEDGTLLKDIAQVFLDAQVHCPNYSTTDLANARAAAATSAVLLLNLAGATWLKEVNQIHENGYNLEALTKDLQALQEQLQEGVEDAEADTVRDAVVGEVISKGAEKVVAKVGGGAIAQQVGGAVAGRVFSYGTLAWEAAKVVRGAADASPGGVAANAASIGGGYIGGAIGMLGGPMGAAAGSVVGNVVGYGLTRIACASFGVPSADE